MLFSKETGSHRYSALKKSGYCLIEFVPTNMQSNIIVVSWFKRIRIVYGTAGKFYDST